MVTRLNGWREAGNSANRWVPVVVSQIMRPSRVCALFCGATGRNAVAWSVRTKWSAGARWTLTCKNLWNLALFLKGQDTAKEALRCCFRVVRVSWSCEVAQKKAMEPTRHPRARQQRDARCTQIPGNLWRLTYGNRDSFLKVEGRPPVFLWVLSQGDARNSSVVLPLDVWPLGLRFDTTDSHIKLPGSPPQHSVCQQGT